MAVAELATIGHPLLRARAAEVPQERLATAELGSLVRDLGDTMRAHDGIGIAAPQIAESERVVLIEIPQDSPRYPGAQAEPLIVFVNPVLTVLDACEQGYWEGCLSVPDLRGLVWRPRAVRVEYQDLEGRDCELLAEDFLATVVQHEFDHLEGVLFIDRVRDTSKLATVDNYRKYWLEDSEAAP